MLIYIKLDFINDNTNRCNKRTKIRNKDGDILQSISGNVRVFFNFVRKKAK